MKKMMKISPKRNDNMNPWEKNRKLMLESVSRKDRNYTFRLTSAEKMREIVSRKNCNKN